MYDVYEIQAVCGLGQSCHKREIQLISKLDFYKIKLSRPRPFKVPIYKTGLWSSQWGLWSNMVSCSSASMKHTYKDEKTWDSFFRTNIWEVPLQAPTTLLTTDGWIIVDVVNYLALKLRREETSEIWLYPFKAQWTMITWTSAQMGVLRS